MREVLFRGKREDNREWVEGSFVEVTFHGKTLYLIFGCDFLFTGDHALVDHSTICQYTGLKDKYDEEIWEGDIVEYKEEYGHIEWDDGDGMYLVVFDGWCVNFSQIWSTEAEVIGNIHDNPDLLERRKEDATD